MLTTTNAWSQGVRLNEVMTKNKNFYSNRKGD